MAAPMSQRGLPGSCTSCRGEAESPGDKGTNPGAKAGQPGAEAVNERRETGPAATRQKPSPGAGHPGLMEG